MISGPAVRDPGGKRVPGLDGSAARGAGGDVGAADKVAVAGEPAVRAGERPPGGPGDSPGAGRAGGGGAPLVDQDRGDPGPGGLVLEAGQEVADPPVPDPLVVPAAGVQGQHAAGVADPQGADPALYRPGDHGRGGLVVGLGHPPPVRGFLLALPGAGLAPPPRPGLPRLRRPPRGCPRAPFPVSQVQVGLGADRPPGDQQPLPARAGDRARVDHPRVYPGDPGRVGLLPVAVGRDRDLGGDLGEQAAALVQQRDRPDLPGRIRGLPVQPHPQRRAAARHRQPQPPPLQGERAVVIAGRHQPPPAPRIPDRGRAGLPAGRGCEPGVAVTAQHRPGTGTVQLPEGSRPG
jgi:hypothetical protein